MFLRLKVALVLLLVLTQIGNLESLRSKLKIDFKRSYDGLTNDE
jgi:hypothetical protein